MLRVLSNEQIAAQEDAERRMREAQAETEVVLNSLVGHIMALWGEAKRAKEDIEQEMLQDRDQLDGIYDDEKLAAMKEVDAPDIFMQITDTKARTCYAWVDENIIQQGKRIWTIAPTPRPDLPDHIRQDINQRIIERTMASLRAMQAQTGIQLPPELLKKVMNSIFEKVGEQVILEMKHEAEQLAEHMSDKIHDQLNEGGFYDCLPDFIKDVIACKAGFIKGPIYRREKIKKINVNQQTGRLEKIIDERIIPTYERRSPFNIYPAPDSTGINDGYLFDVLYLDRKQVYDLIGLEGFNEEAIRKVLRQFDGTGSMKNWLFIDKTVTDVSGATNKETPGSISGKIQCLEFWGYIAGDKLLEYGMTEDEITDPDDSYPICAWIIDGEIIKAVLNYSTFGKKPFHKTSFEKIPDSFWGKSLPQVIKDPQQVCNAAARNLVYNMGMASGPQVEIDEDRVNDRDDSLVPWKKWKSTNEQMQNGPAIRFYQPRMVTNDLIAIYRTFSMVADEHSGIPAFSHGSATVGGAGNTASGFQMLLNQSARGVKQLIKSVDIDIIEPILEEQYEYNIEEEELYPMVFDFRIVAQGYTMFVAKEAQAMRKLEVLPLLSNPVDLQIMGLEGRKQLLTDALDSIGIDSYKIIPPRQEILPAPPEAAQTNPPPNSPQALDAAGNPVVGQDVRQFSPERQRGQVSTPGNPGDAQRGVM